MAGEEQIREDQFFLFDLKVTVERIRGHCTCGMKVGDSFKLYGGKLALEEGSSFCLYALQAAIPLLPAKQRKNRASDWIETDERVVCPDPECGVVLRIDQEGERLFDHDQVSPYPWKGKKPQDPAT
jgi:uncharacterized repeat protein (TIGR04076 family)